MGPGTAFGLRASAVLPGVPLSMHHVIVPARDKACLPRKGWLFPHTAEASCGPMWRTCLCPHQVPLESASQPLHKSEGGRPCFRPPLTTLTRSSLILVSIKPRASLKVFLKTKIGAFS